MRWFRSHICFGTRLALLALALQTMLTFGHVHGLTPSPDKIAFSALTGLPAATTHAAPDPNHNSNGSSDFDCPICALIQLASTSTPSAAPTLTLPATFAVFRPEPAALPELTATPHILFQARGPPTI
jgi:hypothetical protein